jgi:hypothetical protein
MDITAIQPFERRRMYNSVQYFKTQLFLVFEGILFFSMTCYSAWDSMLEDTDQDLVSRAKSTLFTNRPISMPCSRTATAPLDAPVPGARGSDLETIH